MVIDTSALIAYLHGESEAERIESAILASRFRYISAATLVEAGIVAERRGESGGFDLDRLLNRLQVEVVPVTLDQAELARAAYRTYGKGAHAAGLNFGDCFSYALARSLGEPLLFVGRDFSRTDIVAAI